MRLVIEGHTLPGGERFVYLTWGEVDGDRFAMFRRAKLMLADVPDPTAATATARVRLTDAHGLPTCAHRFWSGSERET